METARTLFGPDVWRVSLEVEGEYNDEGGTRYEVRGMSARDKDGVYLEMDTESQAYINAIIEGHGYAGKCSTLEQLFELEHAQYPDIYRNLEDLEEDVLQDYIYGDLSNPILQDEQDFYANKPPAEEYVVYIRECDATPTPR